MKSLLTRIRLDIIKYKIMPYLSDPEYITNYGKNVKNPYNALFRNKYTEEIIDCSSYCLNNPNIEMFKISLKGNFNKNSFKEFLYQCLTFPLL